jgi:hypothetical protein
MQDSILRENLVLLLRGGHAHVSLEQALSGTKAELRNVAPGPGQKSVWEELEHMRLAQEDILRYTVDPSWKSPEWPAGYWPAGPETYSAEAWDASVAAFSSDLEELIELIQRPDLDLTVAVGHSKEVHSYLREVLLAADHSAYHLGQIVQTRKLLGDWPN